MATQETQETQAKKTAAEEKTKLVPVTRDGKTIAVHPDQVEQHQRLGWFPQDKKE